MKLFKKIGDLFGGDLIKTVADTVDRFHFSKEEKEKLKLELKNILFEQKAKAFEMEVEDRESARRMYEKDNSLQKIYALAFLGAYIFLVITLLYGAYQVTVNNVVFSQFVITLISSIFGAMTTKVGTITDFLFGGSMEKKPEPKIQFTSDE